MQQLGPPDWGSLNTETKNYGYESREDSDS
jgi:hypothetical protein